jgi:hypothetical protein
MGSGVCSVLLECAAAAPASTVWASECLAVAEAADPLRPGRFVGLAAGEMAVNARGTTLLVQPALAEAQAAEDRTAVAGSDAEGDAGQSPVGTGGAGLNGRPEPAAAVPHRFYGVVAADRDRLGRDAGRIAQEVVAHVHGLVGTNTEVNIEIRATNPDGCSETVVKIVSENAGAQRFTGHGFEQS